MSMNVVGSVWTSRVSWMGGGGTEREQGTDPVKPRITLSLAVHIFPSQVRVRDLARLTHTYAEVDEMQRSTDEPCGGFWRR